MSTINAERATTVKSGLAKLLAMENISIRHVMGTVTASFDVKARVLRLPVWQGISEDLYDMLVVHEVGHALYTPEAEWMAAIRVLSEKHNPKPGNKDSLAKTVRSIHSFCNIVEDVRIDIKQRKRYPGSKRNYIIGYAELFERDFFGLKKRPINQMSFINRLNVYSKAGFFNVIIVPFTDLEKTYVKRAQETETFQDVLELAEELWLLAQRRGEAGEGEGDGEGDSDDESEQDDTQERGPGSEESEGESSEEESEESDSEENTEGEGESGEGEETEEEGEGADSDEKSDGESEDSDEKPEGEGAGEGESEDENSEGEGDSEEKPSDEPLIPPEAREALDAEKFEKAKEEAKKNEKKEKPKKPQQNDGNFGSVTAGKSKDELENPEDYLPEAETDDAFKNSVDGLAASNGVSYYYSTVPELTGEPWVDFKVYLEENRDFIAKMRNQHNFDLDFSGHQRYLNAFKVEENKTISFMVKEFEMRKSATAYQKSMTAKTGVIDTNKLHSYIYNDDIFKRNTVVPKGKNHGFVMFIDWSGSMQSNILNTVRQLLSLCLFCKRIAVPFEVFSFTSANYYMRNQQKTTGVGFVKTQESLQMEANAIVRNLLSSRMNVSQLNEAMVLLVAMARSYGRAGDLEGNEHYNPDCDQMGGTPLNETIFIAEKIVKKFQKQSKVEVTNVIFLTDGEGSQPALGSNQYNLNARRYQVLIQDPVTRHEYVLPEVNTHSYGRRGNSAYDWTNAILSILKDRTKCNLVGFYLLDHGSSWANIVFRGREYSSSDEQNARKIWRQDGYTPIHNSGYDEYYLVSAKAMELDQKKFELETVAGKKVTTSKITNAFLKHMEKKSTNRLLLSNFIKRIT